MTTMAKGREALLRQIAKRQGLRLMKERRSSTGAPETALYRVISNSRAAGLPTSAMTFDEAWTYIGRKLVWEWSKGESMAPKQTTIEDIERMFEAQKTAPRPSLRIVFIRRKNGYRVGFSDGSNPFKR